MLQFNSALLALAGAFTGPYAPYQSVHLQPHLQGVLVAASDGGKVSMLGYDAKGRGDQACDILVSPDLLRACAGIKSAERDVRIDGDTAAVTTYRKTTSSEVKRFPISYATAPFPPLDRAVSACIQRWSATPALSSTAGRYDTLYLEKAIKSAGHLCESLVLSAFDGGPLRLHGEGLDVMILVMPQTAQPVPPLPQWVQDFAANP